MPAHPEERSTRLAWVRSELPMMGVTPQGNPNLPPPADVWRQYRVKQWTAFTWAEDDRKDHEPMVARAAELFERTLRERYERLDCQVRLVRVAQRPQLVFEATVYAMTEAEAKRRAIYRFEKGLQVKIPHEGRTLTLRPPWGQVRVERIDHG